MHTISDQTGRRFVITDVAAGTGKEATTRLKAVGSTVLIAVRTPSKGEAANAKIRRDHPSAAVEAQQLNRADLSSLPARLSPLAKQLTHTKPVF